MINSERVNEIFLDCLFRDEEDMSYKVIAEGITISIGFHPERLKGHENEIISMLNDLPDKYKNASDGGCSFLSMCNDKFGWKWTSLQQRMEQLYLLGIGIGKIECLLPRDMWESLPGGMPFFVVVVD